MYSLTSYQHWNRRQYLHISIHTILQVASILLLIIVVAAVTFSFAADEEPVVITDEVMSLYNELNGTSYKVLNSDKYLSLNSLVSSPLVSKSYSSWLSSSISLYLLSAFSPSLPYIAMFVALPAPPIASAVSPPVANDWISSLISGVSYLPLYVIAFHAGVIRSLATSSSPQVN